MTSPISRRTAVSYETFAAYTHHTRTHIHTFPSLFSSTSIDKRQTLSIQCTWMIVAENGMCHNIIHCHIIHTIILHRILCIFTMWQNFWSEVISNQQFWIRWNQKAVMLINCTKFIYLVIYTLQRSNGWPFDKSNAQYKISIYSRKYGFYRCEKSLTTSNGPKTKRNQTNWRKKILFLNSLYSTAHRSTAKQLHVYK